MGEMFTLFQKEIEKKQKQGGNYLESGRAVIGENDALYSPGDYAEGAAEAFGR